MAGFEHAGTGVRRENQSHYWCHFNALDSYVSTDGEALDGEYVIPEYGEIDSHKLKIIFRQLIDCAATPGLPEYARRSECSGYLTVLMNELSVAMMQKSGDYDPLQGRSSFVDYVCQWIRANASEICVSDVVKSFPYNHDYLTRIFRQSTGFTIAAYINECKLENAKKLLLETDCSVKEIALMSGFSDEKRMMKLFKKRFDVTASEYRRAFRNILLNNR